MTPKAGDSIKSGFRHQNRCNEKTPQPLLQLADRVCNTIKGIPYLCAHGSTNSRTPPFPLSHGMPGQHLPEPVGGGESCNKSARAAGLNWVVDSAGTNGFHIGEAPHPLSQKVARQHNYEIAGQRARRFTAADFQHFDKIYAMAGDVVDEMRRIAGRAFDPTKVELLMTEVSPGKDLDVPDPWSGPESGYHEVYRMIEDAADKIIQHYGTDTERPATIVPSANPHPPANTPQAPRESAIL